MNIRILLTAPGLRIMVCGLLLATFQSASAIGQLTGRPVEVISGSELMLLDTDGRVHRLKLSGIATLPPNQPWGASARRHLQSLVMGRSVNFIYHSRDRRGKVHGQLRHGGADVNIRLLDAGLARLDPSGLSRTDAERYAAAEERARAAGLGIWDATGREGRSRSRTLPGGPVLRIQR